jgi:hypothetical protein
MEKADLNKAWNVMIQHWHEITSDWKSEKKPFTPEIQKEMYWCGRKVVPHISSRLIAGIVREIMLDLRLKLRGGTPKWKAILKGEMPLPLLRSSWLLNKLEQEN